MPDDRQVLVGHGESWPLTIYQCATGACHVRSFTARHCLCSTTRNGIIKYQETVPVQVVAVDALLSPEALQAGLALDHNMPPECDMLEEDRAHMEMVVKAIISAAGQKDVLA